MSRKGGKRRDGEERRPPKLGGKDDTQAASRAAADDEMFREAMANLGKVPVKDRAPREDEQARQAAPARGGGPLKVDLHRMTVAEAEARVEVALAGAIARLRGSGDRVTVQIITGKGRHSDKGVATLAREVHRFVQRRFRDHIVSIEESPADLVVGELPIRGHFHVTLGNR